MAIENDVSELRRRQKSKNRRNFLIKFFAVLTVAVLVVIAVLTKDSWYPYLDGILTKVPTVSDSTENAELAEGRFPIAVSGGSDYQLKAMDNYFAFLDDSKFYVYTADGEPVIEKQHTYANPILTVSNKKALIYDLGGNGFSLESKYKTIYEKNCDQTILMAELSSNDLAAVVTKSDKYLAQLDIYDSDGKNIFTYKSYDSRIIDVTFLNDNSGCIITTLGASGGKVQSGLIRFSFNSTEMIWQSEKVDCLAVCTSIDENGNVTIIGDTRCVFFDSSGNKLLENEYEDEITDYSCSSKVSAVLMENSLLRKYSLMITDCSDLENPHTVELSEEAKHIFAYNSMVYVFTGSGIYTYNDLGQEISSAKLSDSYENFCKIGNYFFLMGYDEINRISFD
ncbi:MAG: DUF5711 family protein [Oscillospiraceae bacterium]